ncbi:long-chain fatty acid--CoA ligase [Streptomyces sp. F63]|uniref:class I adenylate-forming enzyme family protein n=1 Tax=Streptomyces sp. F63 TaxID=2824887 RepID=UPI001B377BA6|nr:fatty acid--CoA ligase family protein [Streptomyces sp. F63]MBQ0983219.1 long-chain fatty acid--CoA ligase [Streptomyces sp. F63]
MNSAAELTARVEDVAATAPGRPAVVSAGTSLTYAELARRARQQAERWRAEGGSGRRDLVADDPVAVAVALVASATCGTGLLLLDAEGRPAEHERARALFRGAPPTATPGLGLTTSGVDGPPKCVERPWAAVAANSAAFAAALGLRRGETVLCTTPPHHSYAVCGGIVTALTAGATYVGVPRRTGPRALAAAVDTHRVDVLLSVPLLYQWYAAGLPAHHVPRLCVSAGSPLTPDHRSAWERGVGWRLVEHFGTSEYGMLTVGTADRPGSVGPAVDGVRVSVESARHGVADGGEVVVTVPGAPARLLHADGRAEILDGPRRTGDLGAVDADGHLSLLGRVGGVLNVAGNKVSATEVETAARAHPAVRECALVGDSSVPGATRLCLFVEVDGVLNRQALHRHLAAALAPYKIPQAVYEMEALPRSAAGKVLRSELLGLVL